MNSPPKRLSWRSPQSSCLQCSRILPVTTRLKVPRRIHSTSYKWRGLWLPWCGGQTTPTAKQRRELKRIESPMEPHTVTPLGDASCPFPTHSSANPCDSLQFHCHPNHRILPIPEDLRVFLNFVPGGCEEALDGASGAPVNFLLSLRWVLLLAFPLCFHGYLRCH